MNKINQEQIKKYEELQATIKAATKELEKIKAEWIGSKGGESETHVVTLKDNFRETVAGKDAFTLLFGEDFLKTNNLLKLSAYNTIVVAVK